MAQPEGGLLFEIDATSATLDGSENYLNQDDSGNGQNGQETKTLSFSRLIRRSKLETVAN